MTTENVAEVNPAEELMKLKATLKTTTEELDEAKQEIHRMRLISQDHAKEFETLRQQLDQTKLRVMQAQDNGSRWKQRAEKAEAKQPSEVLEKQLAAAKSDVSVAHRAIEGLRSELKAKDQVLKEASQAIATFQRKLEGVSSTMSTMQAARNQAQGERNAAVSRAELAEQAKRELEAKVLALEGELKALKAPAEKAEAVAAGASQKGSE